MSGKSRITFFIILVLALSLMTAVVYADALHRATGTGHITLQNGEYRTLSFAAIEHKDGTVTGQTQAIIHRDPIVLAHTSVDCLKVIDLAPVFPGKLAWIGGEITNAINLPPTIPDPGYAVFGVIDGGEGAEAADYVSVAFVGAPGSLDCQRFGIPFPTNLFLVENGNVQVR